MNWKPFLVAMALVGAGCAAPLRPDPPGPLPWERDYPALPVDREDSLPDLSRSPLVLEDVLAAALTRNPGLEAAREMWEAARARPAQVTALPDPTLGYVRFIDEIETRNGPIEQGITLSQMFPFFGKLAARGDVAEAQALAAWERYAARGLEITERTKSAYFELYWLDQAIRITTENKTLLERQLGVAQTQYAAGRVTLQDVLKAQVELSKLSNDLLTLDEVHGTAIARLNMLLDRPPEAPLGIPAGFEIEGFDKEIDALYDLALRERPELREIDRRTEAARAARRHARLQYFPDFLLGVQYQGVGRTSLGGAPDPGNDAWSAMIGFSLPIWIKKRRAGVREAETRLRALRHERRDMDNRTRFAVKDLHYRLQIEERLVRLYRADLIPQARQALHAAQAGYEAGSVEFINFIDAERSLIAFQLAYERARTDYQQYLAELERIVGMRMTEEGP